MLLKNRILKVDVQEQYLNGLKERILDSHKIYAWGTGRGAKKLLPFINEMDWTGELTFIDINEDKWGELFDGFKIIGPSTFFHDEYDPNALILVTCADVGGVNDIIESYCHHENVEVCDITSIDFNGEETWFDYIWNHIDDFSVAYELLADDKSKDIMVGLLNYRISRDVSYIKGNVEKLDYQYFEKEFVDITGKTVVDCGAFTGDTIESIVRITNGNYGEIYSFEPDSEIYKKLVSNVKKYNWLRVKTFNLGNYRRRDTLRFFSQGSGTEMSNHISEKGDVLIEVDSLDNIIESKVDLIKMDIEGAEYDALLGAKGLIEKYRPILAICIYHKWDDYYKLLNLIHSFDETYKLYIRQYAYNDNETIVYAI